MALVRAPRPVREQHRRRRQRNRADRHKTPERA
jgi:hypothetical protein